VGERADGPAGSMAYAGAKPPSVCTLSMWQYLGNSAK